VIGFLARFVTVWILGLFVLSFVPAIENIAVRGTVASVALCLKMLSFEALVMSPILLLGYGSLEIVPECTPLLQTLALWAAMAAFPSSARWKAIGMLGGAAAIWVLNVARVMILIGFIVWTPSFSAFGHVLVLQTLGLLLVLSLYVAWIQMYRRRMGVR
jgi:exosortase/archaeosortase family protein